jgi:hypothetical protein
MMTGLGTGTGDVLAAHLEIDVSYKQLGGLMGNTSALEVRRQDQN